jgi:transcriptional activator SPT8
MYTLRHSPGHQVHALKGHTNVVSCMSLLPDEKGLLSGSWDGTVRVSRLGSAPWIVLQSRRTAGAYNPQEWDLNTGQTVRTYPTHGPQLSSLALRPFGLPLSPSPSPRAGDDEDGPRENKSVSVGPDFFEKKEGSVLDADAEQNAVEANGQHPSAGSPVPDQANAGENEESGQNGSNGPGGSIGPDGWNGPNGLNGANVDAVDAGEADVDMDKASSHDSLFDEDEDADADGVAESDSVAPSNDVTNTATNTAAATPTSVVPSASVRTQTLALALPGIPRANSAGSTAGPSQAPNRNGTGTGAGTGASALTQQAPRAGAASSIPVLSPATYRQFSDDVLLYSSMDGQVVLIDRRVPSYEGTSGGVGRLLPGERAPPWCMSVSADLKRSEGVPPTRSSHLLVICEAWVTASAAQ